MFRNAVRSVVSPESVRRAKWRLGEARDYYKFVHSALSDVDAVVVVGGGQLLKDNQFQFLPRLAAIAKVANENRLPLGIFGCGAGQMSHGEAESQLGEILAHAKFVCLRDSVSVENIRSILGQRDVAVIPDVVFASSERGRTTRDRQLVNERLVGINVMSYEILSRSGWHVQMSENEYVTGISQLIEGAEAAGCKVCLFTTGDSADMLQIESICRVMEGRTNAHFSFPDSPQMLLETVSRFSSVFSMRMHAGIVASAMGKAVAAIEWGGKVRACWEAFGDSQRVVDASVLCSNAPWMAIQEHLESPVSGTLLGDADNSLQLHSRKCAEVLLKAMEAIPPKYPLAE
jgi:polysaccharide pyruvyl transferase WcaK-like protein